MSTINTCKKIGIVSLLTVSASIFYKFYNTHTDINMFCKINNISKKELIDNSTKNNCCKLYYLSISHTLFTSSYDKNNINDIFKKYSNDEIKYVLIGHYHYHLPFTFILRNLEMSYIKCTNPLFCNQETNPIRIPDTIRAQDMPMFCMRSLLPKPEYEPEPDPTKPKET